MSRTGPTWKPGRTTASARIASQEFTDIYVLDLGSDVRRNPKISGTTHNVFGIQTGVAIGFFVREKARLGQCAIHYARREDAELAKDKLAYLKDAKLDGVGFEGIAPDKRNDWLNQSNSDFERLLPSSLAEKQNWPRLSPMNAGCLRVVLYGSRDQQG